MNKRKTVSVAGVSIEDEHLVIILLKIYLIIAGLLKNGNVYEEFCIITSGKKSNLATAQSLYIDERTLVRRRARYREIAEIITAQLATLKELLLEHKF